MEQLRNSAIKFTGLTTNRMLHNSYFQVLLEQSTSIMSNKVAIVAPPAAAHMHLLHSKQENMDQLGFDFF
jgi:hypothetical protein